MASLNYVNMCMCMGTETVGGMVSVSGSKPCSCGSMAADMWAR